MPHSWPGSKEAYTQNSLTACVRNDKAVWSMQACRTTSATLLRHGLPLFVLVPEICVAVNLHFFSSFPENVRYFFRPLFRIL